MNILSFLSPFSVVKYLTLWGGGGGGGGPSAEQNRLYGAQARAAEYQLDLAMPHLPGVIGNSSAMVDEAMSGKLGERMRNQAGVDSAAASAASEAAQLRRMQSMGAAGDPSSAGFKEMGIRNAQNSALNKVSAMNSAGNWAEDQKWNRNAGFLGQLSGMNSGAMQGMGSAASGFGQAANAQMQNDAANARGYGQAGSAMAYQAMKADGGYIEKPGLRLASGGAASWSAYKNQNPIRASGGGGGGVNPYKAIAAGAAPHLIGALFNKGKDGQMGWEKTADWFKDKYNSAFPQTYTPDSTPTGMQFSVADNGYDFPAQPQNLDVSGTLDATQQVLPEAFADGGYAQKPGLRFATGGRVFQPLGNTNMTQNMPIAPYQPPKPTVGLGDAQSAYQGGKTAYAAADAAEKAEQTSSFMDAARNASETMSAAETAGQAATAADAINGAAGVSPYGSMAKAAMDIASGRDATEAAKDAASGWAGAQAGALAGSALGPIGTGVGAVIGGLGGSALFAKGGRVDMRPGGPVSGPGTTTSDDIPAWLSDKEYVLNAEATAMVGKKKLDKVNNKGLAVRRARAKGKPVPKGKAGLNLKKGA